MKKTLLATAIFSLLLSIGASAQSRGGNDVEGSIRMDNGRTTVRINVGDSRDDRDMLKRVYRLEQAVRDLQEQVYKLQSQPTRRNVVVCSAEFFSVGSVLAKGGTRVEAMAHLLQECRNRGGSKIFCEEDDADNLRCETTQE